MPFLRARGRQVLLLHGVRRKQGKVSHKTLHIFRSLRELAETLKPEHWNAFTEAREKAYPGLNFDWVRLHSQGMLLTQSVEEKTAEGAEKRIEDIRKIIGALYSKLQYLAPAREEDYHILLGAGYDLRRLVHLGHLLLALMPAGPGNQNGRDQNMVDLICRMHFPDTEHLIERAREQWDMGKKKQAGITFEKARKLDPIDADIINSEGVCLLESGRIAAAEAYFRRALELARYQLPIGRRSFSWGELDARPYLRALYNLGLTLDKQGKTREAIALWEEAIRLCPDDGVGAGFCLGPAWHRLGDLEKAIDYYRNSPCVPDQLYNSAIVHITRNEFDEAIEALIGGFFENPFIPPLLLGEEVKEKDIFMSSNLESLEWANDYVKENRDLWAAGVLEFLRKVWEDPEMQEAHHMMLAIQRGIKITEDGDKRSMLIHSLNENKRKLLSKATRARILERIHPSLTRKRGSGSPCGISFSARRG